MSLPVSTNNCAPSILIVSGGYISGKESRFWSLFKRQVLQIFFGRQAWLDVKIKLNFLESLLLRKPVRSRASGPAARLVAKQTNLDVPELTEVVLATLLKTAGLSYEAVSIDDLFDNPKLRRILLSRNQVIFLSTTFLRDISELSPVLKVLNRSKNKIVVGGPLAALMPDDLAALPEIDALAIGYGEYLVPKIADWIKSGFKAIEAPERGRITHSGRVLKIYSGSPKGRHLDELPTPDWSLVSPKSSGTKLIHYESVRGCPYRCHFCNYPYLFDDTVFRYKTAEKIADDWERYVNELGVEYINCLDSLFTAPRHRLEKFCNILIQRNVKVRWICYARAGDLKQRETVALMKAAGLWQVHIGIESGDAAQLINMNKMCTLQDNASALDNCRLEDVTTLVSFVVGYPGETVESLDNTFNFLRNHPADFFFTATFSTRVAGVPVLSPKNRSKYGLVTGSCPYTVAPYWTHDTMDCSQAADAARKLTRRFMKEKVALNATLFYANMLEYSPVVRAELLELQKQAVLRNSVAFRTLDQLHRVIDWRLKPQLLRLRSDMAGDHLAVSHGQENIITS